MESARADASARLILLRHGQGSLGSEDYDRLSESGRAQSSLLGRRLATELAPGWQAWSGSLRRHRQTLRALPVSAEAYIEPALNEYRVDQLIKHALDQAAELGLAVPPAQAFADPAAFLQTFLDWFPAVLEQWQARRLVDPENGNWPDFHQRVLSPLERWKQALADGRNVVVVSSAGVISTVVAELLGQDLSWQRSLNVSLYNASWTDLALRADGAWCLGRVNCVAHLERRELVTLA
ncbi:MAG: histidine phosphatase family protein [Wenzhouxiangella sp.]